MSRFIQLHSLISYPASLLNRDDAGFAKRIHFGDSPRVRVSSQCLKRHWRQAEGPHSIREAGDGLSIRSREIFQRMIVAPLLAEGFDAKLIEEVTRAVMAEVLGESSKAKDEKAEEKKAKKAKKGDEQLALLSEEESPEAVASSLNLKTNQVIVLGQPEVKFLLDNIRALLQEADTAKDAKAKVKAWLTKDTKKNLKVVGAGIDAALFGRMVTSDILARGDAAIHVAHAMTVHKGHFETDYFSALDDLEKADGALGSGHINTTELTTGIYYTYVVIDTRLLLSNLGGDAALAREVIEKFIHLMATVSPGAKLGSTAPYAAAHLMLAEKGEHQPRTLANAFIKGVDTRDPLNAAYSALAQHLKALDGMYGPTTTRKLAALEPTPELLSAVGGDVTPLSDLATWTTAEIG
ncbi:type I-E CRISPR-associated protein Cas7/Cse4/CasC [Myxococcota bacterium]|nr:type I-E CRISPR-associated protein Cas7/Cse4/CasC [Myxococcota bacterium]